MLKQIEKTGKTVEEALELALIEMDLTRDEVEYEVLEEESKGLLGIFGNKDAKILVTQKENAHLVAEEYLNGILEQLDPTAELEVGISDNLVDAKINGEDTALIIGHRGKTLDAIQYLATLVVNKNRDEFIHVSVDSEDYRKKKKDSIVRLAQRMAEKAKKQRKDIILKPMNSYQRRIVHTALMDDDSVTTKSEGNDPYRKVIIMLNR